MILAAEILFHALRVESGCPGSKKKENQTSWRRRSLRRENEEELVTKRERKWGRKRE